MSGLKYDMGLRARKEVLGEAYVDKAFRDASEFSRPLQKFLTENCWGEIWTKSVLTKDTRSLITIGMLAALGASEELKVHVHGALRNGCSVEEIQDVLLQVAVYCGAPSGIIAFRSAESVLNDWIE